MKSGLDGFGLNLAIPTENVMVKFYFLKDNNVLFTFLSCRTPASSHCDAYIDDSCNFPFIHQICFFN